MQSHPSWVCGLKHIEVTNTTPCLAVTPFVGVWIETISFASIVISLAVTPFVGVWIETIKKSMTDEAIDVTPFVGVWIETIIKIKTVKKEVSHPSWVCGLKPHIAW